MAERTRELSTLLAVSRSVASTLELAPLLDLILDQLKAVVDYAGASVCTIEGADLRILASRGATPADREEGAIGLRLPLARGGALWERIGSQEAVVIADVRSSEPLAQAYRAWLEAELSAPAFRYVRSWLGVPLAADDRVIGLISLSTRQPGSYTPHHVRLATAVASQAALAIEKARLYRQAQEETRRTAALARIAASVALAGPLETILRGLAQSVVEATGAEAGAVVLTEGEPPRPRYAGAYGLPEGYGPAMAEAVQRGGPLFSQVAIEQGRPLVLRDVWPVLLARPELAPIHRFYSQVQWDTIVSTPLVARGRRLGVLTCYYRSDREPDAEAIAFQSAIADQAAVAVENARLFAEAQERAVIEERTRLAHELHDSATQTVFSVGMLARAAQAQHAQGSPQLGATLERVARLAQDALVEMRALLVELRPETLAEQGLDAAFTRLVELFRARTSMAICYHGASVPRLAADTELAVFRIVQEALGNAVKHAEASEAEVRLAVETNTLSVTVRDNGRGFDPEASVSASADGRRGGQGLRSMRERAAAAGLRLHIESAPSAGTTVTVAAPLSP
ncbi:MAG TPA: GAF domain-containing sensor histidine kinase [Dehalococcoidia bacterium]